jgi:hypothetical protein
METEISKSWFTLKPQIVKFSKSVGTFNFIGSGNTDNDLYEVQFSMMTYCFVFHFLWWAVTFDMENKEGFGKERYEKETENIIEKLMSHENDI